MTWEFQRLSAKYYRHSATLTHLCVISSRTNRRKAEESNGDPGDHSCQHLPSDSWRKTSANLALPKILPWLHQSMPALSTSSRKSSCLGTWRVMPQECGRSSGITHQSLCNEEPKRHHSHHLLCVHHIPRRDLLKLGQVKRDQTNGCLVKATVFPVVLTNWRVGPSRRLSTQKLMLSNWGAGEDSWESLGLQGDSTSLS